MRKFMFLFVLCGLISGQAWGLDCVETYVTANVRFGCDTEDQTSTEFEYNSVIQTVGEGYCYNNTGTKFNNARITCKDADGTSDDVWNITTGKMCDGSKLDNPEADNALYTVLGHESELGGPMPKNDSGKSHGFLDACLLGYCKLGYVLNSDAMSCKSVSDVAKCKESDIKFTDSTNGDWKATGGNVGVYCFKQSDLQHQILASEIQGNICLANQHKIRNVKDPAKYFSCNGNGKWEEQTYPDCGTGSECTKGDEGCIAVPVDSSTNEVIITAAGTGQDWIIDTGSTVCVRWECNPATHEKLGNKCITKTQAQTNRDNAARATRTAQENKNACQNSGGTWASGRCTCPTPNVDLIGNSCVCKSGYEWNTDKKQGCKLTDKEALKTACNAAPAGTATWNDAAGACVCTNPDQTFDMATRMCKDNADFAACQPLVARGVATWNSGAKQCVCNQPGYIVQNNDCVESPEAAAERERREKEAAERANAEALRKSRRNISDAHGILVGMRETFKASVWKDEEGKFNTSRLVSDSIAGVVLGTVGGVVTSNVVKKNQVEDGFEDIKCTVGGQTVADWGDEFRVGIQ